MACVRIMVLACLCALAVTLRAEDIPAASPESQDVGLNHFYAVLDEETFMALRDSEWLRTRFAAVDTGLPNFTPPQADSQRLYLRGRTTYIEFLGPNNPFKEPVGKLGIALGVDQLTLLDGLQRAWSDKLGGAAERHRLEWKKATPPVPWYEVVQHPSTADNPHLVLWASAYRPEFLPWLYPQVSKPAKGTRAEFLAPQFREERIFGDITGLVVAVPDPVRQQIAKQLQAIGYVKVEQGGSLRLESAEWTLTLLQSSASCTGLRAITMATNGDIADVAEISLGARSRISWGDARTATWTFAEAC